MLQAPDLMVSDGYLLWQAPVLCTHVIRYECKKAEDSKQSKHLEIDFPALVAAASEVQLVRHP